MRTRTKICGITRAVDAEAAVRHGADAIGLVFYPPSPRFVELQKAKDICDSLPAFVSSVGLFVDASTEQINVVLDELPLSLIQFHGSESGSFCESFGRPYIKAVRVSGELTACELQAQLEDEIADHPKACGFLFDAYVEGVPGGTGHTFDWGLLPSGFCKPVILAGGIGAENVRQAIQSTQPYAVDVSSGLESAPGLKDEEKIRQLMQNVALENGSQF